MKMVMMVKMVMMPLRWSLNEMMMCWAAAGQDVSQLEPKRLRNDADGNVDDDGDDDDDADGNCDDDGDDDEGDDCDGNGDR